MVAELREFLLWHGEFMAQGRPLAALGAPTRRVGSSIAGAADQNEAPTPMDQEVEDDDKEGCLDRDKLEPRAADADGEPGEDCADNDDDEDDEEEEECDEEGVAVEGADEKEQIALSAEEIAALPESDLVQRVVDIIENSAAPNASAAARELHGRYVPRYMLTTAVGAIPTLPARCH